MHCKIMLIIVMLFLAWLLEEAAAEPRLRWFSGRRRRRRSCRKVNCELNSWSSWSRCSHTCGPNGAQQRHRSIRKLASCGGACDPTHESRSCNLVCFNGGSLKYGRCSCKYGYTGDCCQNGHGWTSWGPWCKCSTTCGRGTQYRTRSCHGSCSGNSKEYRSCLLKQCKGVSGGWSSWSRWGACTGSCGTGLQIRQRSCTNPPPSYGGQKCRGPSEQHKNCFLKACPVNGGWSSWGRWAKCSKTCGDGTQIRRRYCNRPTPRYGGKPCPGSSRATRSCKTKSCPVNGRWSPWGKWCACSKTCNGGSQYRERYCNNPRPENGGKSCSGQRKQTRRCNTQHCPVNGGWSHWSTWGACSKPCGDGKQYSRRVCNNPKPKYGGKGCFGSSQKVQTCTLRACPVNGRWNLWEIWSKCSKTCGTGSQTRHRFCTNPPPDAGGKDCTGPSQQTKSCSIKTCSVNGGWGDWTDWSTCSVTCGSGTSFRTRLCNNPTPGPGGQPCPGLSVSSRDCNLGDCDDNEECWSDWSKWCSCTKACGCGKRYRARYCTCAFGEGYKNCKGHSEESQSCNCHLCPTGPPRDNIQG